ncbi:MAG: peptide deformylase [Firmicutes bacterium]|nr:peptide deformylase [Bacillota bacterium]
MAVLEIREDGDPILRQVAKPVAKITKRHRKLIKDMIQTMHAAEGIGLAAPQIGISERIIVVDTGDEIVALFNPVIDEMSQDQDIDVEGCLSIPGKRGYVQRATEIVVSGWQEDGKPVRYRVSGYPARIFQHEIDHLDGVLFIDKLVEVKVEEDSEGE